jgi:hypothetical protein
MKRKEKIAKEIYKLMDRALVRVGVMIFMIFIGIIWIGGMFVIGFFLRQKHIFFVLFVLSYLMMGYSIIMNMLWSLISKKGKGGK